MSLCHMEIYKYTNQNVQFKKIMSHRLYIFSDEDTSSTTFFRTMFLHQTTQILTCNYMQHDPTFLDPILSMTPSSVSSFINICTDLREISITEASSSCVTDGLSRCNSNRYSRSDSVPASFALYIFLLCVQKCTDWNRFIYQSYTFCEPDTFLFRQCIISTCPITYFKYVTILILLIILKYAAFDSLTSNF